MTRRISVERYRSAQKDIGKIPSSFLPSSGRRLRRGPRWTVAHSTCRRAACRALFGPPAPSPSANPYPSSHPPSPLPFAPTMKETLVLTLGSNEPPLTMIDLSPRVNQREAWPNIVSLSLPDAGYLSCSPWLRVVGTAHRSGMASQSQHWRDRDPSSSC